MFWLFGYWDSGQTVVPPTPPSVEEGGPGRVKWKPVKRIKRSEYVHQQEYREAVEKAARELAAASVPLSRVGNDGKVIGDDEIEDDDIILVALTRILH